MAISGAAQAGGLGSVALHGTAAVSWLLQETVPAGQTQWLTIFVGMTAVAFVVIAISMIVLAFVGLKLRTEIVKDINELKARALPIMDKSNSLLADLTPQIKSITARVTEIAASVEKITDIARDKAIELSPAVSAARETFMEANDTVRDANQKTKAQVARVNGMISATLDASARLGRKIHHSIDLPAREIAGVVSGVKAGLDVILHGARVYGRGPRPAAPPQPATLPLQADKRDLGL